jgi:hypothetical protein
MGYLAMPVVEHACTPLPKRSVEIEHGFVACFLSFFACLLLACYSLCFVVLLLFCSLICERWFHPGAAVFSAFSAYSMTF